MTMLVVLLYGLCAWGAACNLPAWARLFWARVRGERLAAVTDVYATVRAAILLSALGTVGLSGDRLRAHLVGEMPLRVPTDIGLASIALMAGAEVLFLRGAALQAHARGAPAWSWRIYWLGAAIWSALTILAA